MSIGACGVVDFGDMYWGYVLGICIRDMYWGYVAGICCGDMLVASAVGVCHIAGICGRDTL